MIRVHLLSEEVVKWCRFQNEISGVHLLLVGTSSVLVCMIGVHLLSVRTSNIVTRLVYIYCPIKTSSILPLVQMMMVKQLKCLGFIKINYFLS